MPSATHEALIELFRNRPSLAAELLNDQFNIRLPPHRKARLDSGDLANVIPTEYRADAVVVLATEDSPALAVIVEVQLRRDHGKRWSWPVYLTTLRARLRCPTILLVICTDPATATWCATNIDTGHPGLILSPLVIGPHQVPVITDLGQAQHRPELAVLSAMAHPNHPERDKIFHALLDTLNTIEPARATLYHDVVMAALPTAARQHLEAIMSSGLREYQSEFARKYVFQGRAEGRVEGKAEGKAEGRVEGKAEGRVEGKAEGKAEGRVEALLAVLDARHIDVPDEARTRITSCTDLDQLNTWIRQAANATAVTDLFDY